MHAEPLAVRVHRRCVDAAAQEEARLGARIRRGDMQHERMQENNVARRTRVLDDLEWDVVHRLHAIHEARNARVCIVFRMQIADIRMFPKQEAERRAARVLWRRVVLEPFVYEPVRAAHQLCVRRRVAQHRRTARVYAPPRAG